MAITKCSREYHEKMFPGYHSSLWETDPEFIERFDNFAFDEVINEEAVSYTHLSYGHELEQSDEYLFTTSGVFRYR